MHIYRIYSCYTINQNRWKNRIYVPQTNSINGIQMISKWTRSPIQYLQWKALFFLPLIHWCLSVQRCCQLHNQFVKTDVFRVMQFMLHPSCVWIKHQGTERSTLSISVLRFLMFQAYIKEIRTFIQHKKPLQTRNDFKNWRETH